MDLDLLLHGGRIADGTGSELLPADLGVQQNKIMILPPGSVPADRARESFDVSGLIVAPGFIDAHTHSDETALGTLGEAVAHAAVLQGVTVEICGNCGTSAFPGGYADFPAFAAAHDAAGRVNHIASLVGHGSLRGHVVGHEARPATKAEIDRMCGLLNEALAAGAVGLSTGLIYTPGCYAGTEEIVALAAVAARHGKPYVTHLRDEMAQVQAALAEAVEIAEKSGAALHVSHHKTAGKYAWAAPSERCRSWRPCARTEWTSRAMCIRTRPPAPPCPRCFRPGRTTAARTGCWRGSPTRGSGS